MEAAEEALRTANETQAAAAERQAEVAKKLGAYQDAKEKVEKAEEALKAKLSGDLQSGKLNLIATEGFDKNLDGLKLALEQAKKEADDAKAAYDAAKKTADKAEQAASDAKDAADEAKRQADQELEDFNNRYEEPETPETTETPDTPTAAGDADEDTPAPAELEIEDLAVPLASGPITRAQFVDYLWRHEGSPASEAPTFDDVPADYEFAPAIGWAQAAGLVTAVEGNNFQPEELVTVEMVRGILGNFASEFGTNAVEAAALTTLVGEGGEAVLNCDEVLAEFFGEEYVSPVDESELETEVEPAA